MNVIPRGVLRLEESRFYSHTLGITYWSASQIPQSASLHRNDNWTRFSVPPWCNSITAQPKYAGSLPGAHLMLQPKLAR